MHTRSWLRLIALLAVLAVALPAAAKPVSRKINLGQPARFGATQLDAGNYKLLVDGTRLTVKKGKEVVAEVEGQWEERAARSPYTSVLIGTNGQVKEIRFNGERRVLVLRSN